ncbi:MAG: glutathione S-transferase family protein [Pseudorhodobacter sp.]|nr:glutathione S-transferase family protein [Pseudorhodobacter sp.]
METTAPYILHYAPDNASLIVRLALEQRGLPYRTALVDRARRAQDSAAYKRLNPQGLIPVLETDAGAVFETGAILLWLADRHGGLGPAPADPARGAFLKWLFFTSNTLHADLRMLFYPARYVGADAGAQAALHDAATQRLHRHFTLLNEAAASGTGLFAGTEPTALGWYLLVCVRWSALYPERGTAWFSIARYPRLHALALRHETHPAMIRASQAEGLGPAPISSPCRPQPPEGSPT